MQTTPPGTHCQRCNHPLDPFDVACGRCHAVVTPSALLPGRMGMAGLSAHAAQIRAKLAARKAAHHGDADGNARGGAGQGGAWDAMRRRFVLPEVSPNADTAANARTQWQPIALARTHTDTNPFVVEAELNAPERPFVSYVLQHCGLGAVQRVVVQNLSEAATPSCIIEIGLQPSGYGSPWVGTIPPLKPHEIWRAENIVLPLNLERLRAVRETENAQLHLRIKQGDTDMFAQSTSIAVNAYNEWVWMDKFFQLTAAFVQSGHPALSEVITLGFEHLEAATGKRSFSGYQSGEAAHTVAMLEALHDALADDVHMRYINPPPSHEARGQKLRLVDESLRARCGTCFDLAVLQAALWEHIGLAPVIVLVPGHALLACWLVEPPADRPSVVTLGKQRKSSEYLIDCFNQHRLLPINSVEIASGEPLEVAINNGADILNGWLSQRAPIHMIDIAAARRDTPPIKPLP
jgi:hypothetical protein